MTTQQIADRLVELCRKGEYTAAQEELYADDAVSIEPDGSPGLKTVTGRDAIVQKGHNFMAMIEEVHSSEVSDAVIAGDRFAVAATFEATFKGMGRQVMAEICVYSVKDGKIVKEQFIY